MRCTRVTSLVATCMAIAACGLVRDPLTVTLTEERTVLTSVLLSGDSTARVLLSMAATNQPASPFEPPEWFPIGDATVRLVSGFDTIPLVSQSGAAENPCVAGPLYEATPARDLLPGCYAGAVPGAVRAGATYTLIVDLTGGGRIEGQTTVPAQPTMVEPGSGSAVTIGSAEAGAQSSVRVTWSGAPADHAVQLGVSSRDAVCNVFLTAPGGIGRIDWITVIGDSEAAVLIRSDCSLPGGVPGEITLTAFDTSYTRYIDATRENHPLVDASAGFTGPAVGVFGSAAMLRQPVHFVEQ